MRLNCTGCDDARVSRLYVGGAANERKAKDSTDTMVAMCERAIVLVRDKQLERVTVNECRSKPYLEAAVRIAWELAEARGWKMVKSQRES